MKTITFYSYKGGVGRSLALSSIATRLSELNKRVCVIDFDLDAPGLRFKFSGYSFDPIKRGLVDYIYSFSVKGELPPSIRDYVTTLKSNNSNSGNIDFISAGDIDSKEYWKKLSMIKWAEMFYSEKGQGIRFFLDLKAKIEKEINPDFLLIDSRTGITDISGITLRLFADEIVVLAVNNPENIFGSKKIIKSLLSPSVPLKKNPKVRFVLTRLPFTDTPKDREKEFALIQEREKEFMGDLGVDDFEISVIHSDRRLEEQERNLMADNYDNSRASISNDYLKLFDMLTEGLLSQAELDRFKNLRAAAREFQSAVIEDDLAKKLIHLDKAIALDAKRVDFYIERGETKWELKQFESAINDYQKALELNPDSVTVVFALGVLYFNIKQFDEAIAYIDRVLAIFPNTYAIKAEILTQSGRVNEAEALLSKVVEKYPNNDTILNSYAHIMRLQGNSEIAFTNVYKAIEINPNESAYFATLAEIFADIENIEAFYFNLTLALSKGLTPELMMGAFDVYEKFLNEKRFVDLLSKYHFSIEDLQVQNR